MVGLKERSLHPVRMKSAETRRNPETKPLPVPPHGVFISTSETDVPKDCFWNRLFTRGGMTHGAEAVKRFCLR
jgi:hypothetical protein